MDYLRKNKMKISVITTICDPDKRFDPYLEAIENYYDFADEVIIVNGGGLVSKVVWNIGRYLGERMKLIEKIKIIPYEWKRDWSWEELPKHLNRGLEEARGDWVIKLDIDQLIHERDFRMIREVLENIGDMPTASFQKFSVYPMKKYLQKGEQVIAINKGKYKDRIKFGKNVEKYTDLCLPIWWNGDLDLMGVPMGEGMVRKKIYRTGISFWNFDYTFKPMEFVVEEFYRFSMAHKKYFGKTSWGQTKEDSFEVFIKLMRGRMSRCPYQIESLKILPSSIREKYSNLSPAEFGYEGWRLL